MIIRELPEGGFLCGIAKCNVMNTNKWKGCLTMKDLVLDGNILTDNASGTVYDLSAKVPGMTIFYFYLGGVLLLMTLITMMIIIKKRFKTSFINLIIGVLTYVMFPYLLYSILSIIIVQLPGIKDLLNNNDIAKIIVNGILVALVYGLALMLPLIVGRDKIKQAPDAMYCGLGLSVGIAFSPIINYIYNAAIADYLNDAGGVIGMLEEGSSLKEYYDLASALNSIITVKSEWFLYDIMSVLFICIITVAAAMILYGVDNLKLPKIYIVVVAFVYFVISVVAEIRRMELANIGLMFVIELLIFAAVIFGAYVIQKKYMGNFLKREKIVVTNLKKPTKTKFLR